jgi:proteasome lid subunit RPN8/RPN11
MEIVGIYHSHPARPIPSKVDLGYMKWSAPVWLIVSSLNWKYGAYRLQDGSPVEVEVKLV